MPNSRKRGSRVTAFVTALVTAELLVAGPGAARSVAAPAGAVVLDRGASAFPQDLVVDRVLPDWVIYHEFPLPGRFAPEFVPHTVYAQPRAGGIRTVVSTNALGPVDAAGDRVWTGQGSDRVATDLTTGTRSPVPTRWQRAYPSGGLYLTDSPGGVQLWAETYADPATPTVLATLPTGTPVDAEILASPTGALVVNGYAADAADRATFAPYDGSGSHPVASPAVSAGNLRCYSVTADAAGCSTGSYLDAIGVWRLPFNGVPARAATLSRPPYEVNPDVLVTDQVTAWSATFAKTDQHQPEPPGPTNLFSVPAGGGATSEWPSTPISNGGSDASALYLSRAGALGTQALITTTDAHTAPTVVRLADPRPITGTGVIPTPGRVVWQDTRRTDLPLYSRRVHVSGPSITVGPLVRVASQAVRWAVSGPRTVWLGPASTGPTPAATIRTDDQRAQGVVATGALPEGALTVSGNRVLFQRASDRHFVVRDLARRSTRDVSVAFRLRTVDLAGNYLVFGRSDGSVWRADLASTAAPVRLAAAMPSGHADPRPNVLVAGRFVAWQRVYYTPTSGRQLAAVTYDTVTHRHVTLPASMRIAHAGNSGVVVRVQATGDVHYALVPWTRSTAIRLPGDEFTQLAVDGDTVGSSDDDVPVVSPLPRHVRARPQSLGDPVVTTRVHPGHDFILRLQTTATLTSCKVRIRNAAGHAVRLLSCHSVAAEQGMVDVAWNARTSTGHRLPTGSYTWTAEAANGDGTLANPAGTASATRGRFRLLAA